MKTKEDRSDVKEMTEREEIRMIAGERGAPLTWTVEVSGMTGGRVGPARRGQD